MSEGSRSLLLWRSNVPEKTALSSVLVVLPAGCGVGGRIGGWRGSHLMSIGAGCSDGAERNWRWMSGD